MTKNPYAKALANPLFAHRIVRLKKGKGSYKRNKNFTKKVDGCLKNNSIVIQTSNGED